MSDSTSIFAQNEKPLRLYQRLGMAVLMTALMIGGSAAASWFDGASSWAPSSAFYVYGASYLFSIPFFSVSLLALLFVKSRSSLMRWAWVWLLIALCSGLIIMFVLNLL